MTEELNLIKHLKNYFGFDSFKGDQEAIIRNVLNGKVTNITQFGAFVDIGVHKEGLVHVSQMAERRVQDPSKVVKIGQVVRVRVLSVDVDRQRIALSLRIQ